MSKFEYRNDDDDYEDDYDDEDGSDLEFDDDEDEIYNDLLEQELALQSDQLDVAEKELHQRMINDALILNSKSWLWSFYSLETKLKMINKTFVFMKGLTDLPAKQN
jgi:hypothetical protein